MGELRFVTADEAPNGVRIGRLHFVCCAVTGSSLRCRRPARWSERDELRAPGVTLLCDQHHTLFCRRGRIGVVC